MLLPPDVRTGDVTTGGLYVETQRKCHEALAGIYRGDIAPRTRSVRPPMPSRQPAVSRQDRWPPRCVTNEFTLNLADRCLRSGSRVKFICVGPGPPHLQTASSNFHLRCNSLSSLRRRTASHSPVNRSMSHSVIQPLMYCRIVRVAVRSGASVAGGSQSYASRYSSLNSQTGAGQFVDPRHPQAMGTHGLCDMRHRADRQPCLVVPLLQPQPLAQVGSCPRAPRSPR